MRDGIDSGTTDGISGRAEPGEPRPLRIVADGEIHVWFCLPHEANATAGAFALLDDAEAERAGGFRFERDRTRFIAHHAFTRRVLARYVDEPPTALTVRTGSHGKPELDPAYGIEFSSSRSGGLSVVAVGRRGDHIGVDVERVRPIDDAVLLAHGLFSDAERRYLGTVPDSARNEAFLVLWTRKEAVVKAFGLGLSVPLDSFEVTTASSPRGTLHGGLGSTPFVVQTIEAPTGWVAAVSATAAQLTVQPMDVTEVTP